MGYMYSSGGLNRARRGGGKDGVGRGRMGWVGFDMEEDGSEVGE